jgi:hypothetical protein
VSASLETVSVLVWILLNSVPVLFSSAHICKRGEQLLNEGGRRSDSPPNCRIHLKCNLHHLSEFGDGAARNVIC